jgi:hypothetical protein
MILICWTKANINFKFWRSTINFNKIPMKLTFLISNTSTGFRRTTRKWKIKLHKKMRPTFKTSTHLLQRRNTKKISFKIKMRRSPKTVNFFHRYPYLKLIAQEKRILAKKLQSNKKSKKERMDLEVFPLTDSSTLLRYVFTFGKTIIILINQ